MKLLAILIPTLLCAQPYTLGPDSQRRPDVPRGKGGTTGLMFGADGRLYAAESTRKRVVAYAPDGKLSVLATGVTPNDLAVTSQGDVYFTDTAAKRVYHLDAKGARRVVFGGPGLKTLYVTAGDKIYQRVPRRQGHLPWEPVKLPRPQL